MTKEQFLKKYGHIKDSETALRIANQVETDGLAKKSDTAKINALLLTARLRHMAKSLPSRYASTPVVEGGH
jgi:hypothetical protein